MQSNLTEEELNKYLKRKIKKVLPKSIFKTHKKKNNIILIYRNYI